MPIACPAFGDAGCVGARPPCAASARPRGASGRVPVGSGSARALGSDQFRQECERGRHANAVRCLIVLAPGRGYLPGLIREACEASISGHAAKVEADIAEAMKRYRIRGPWTAESLALHTQAVLQGAFILAKAKGDAAIAAASIDHLRRYIKLLFQPVKRKREETL